MWKCRVPADMRLQPGEARFILSIMGDWGAAQALAQNRLGGVMRRIAVINQKGGVGKTTTTANLGAALAASGRRVLLIDLDPQSHLTMHFVETSPAEESDAPSAYDVFTDNVSLEKAIYEVGEGVSVVPAHIDLAGAETELVNVVGREAILRDGMRGLDNRFDYLLVDCPPSLGTLTVNALVACDEVIIPLQAHFLALQGLSKLLETVTLVRQRINPDIRITGVVLCMFDAGTKLATEVAEDIGGFLESSRGTDSAWADAKLFGTRIRRNIKLAESPSYGQTVFSYAPTSNGAIDYRKLADELLAMQIREADAATGAVNRISGTKLRSRRHVEARTVPVDEHARVGAGAVDDGERKNQVEESHNETHAVESEIDAIGCQEEALSESDVSGSGGECHHERVEASRADAAGNGELEAVSLDDPSVASDSNDEGESGVADAKTAQPTHASDEPSRASQTS